MGMVWIVSAQILAALFPATVATGLSDRLARRRPRQDSPGQHPGQHPGGHPGRHPGRHPGQWPAALSASPARCLARCARGVLAALFVVTAATTAPPAVAETYQITDLYGTGVGNDYQLISQGSSDPHYTITKVQFLSGTTGPGYPPASDSQWLGAPKAYRIDPWSPNNTSGTRPSQWVAPNGSTEALPPFTPTGQFVDAPVAQYYAYQTSFTIPDDNWEFAEIAGQWIADNTGTGIFLNGSRINALANWSYSSANVADTFFKAGVNTLEFRVRNLIESPGDFANPTGLQVTVNAAYYLATPVPEPSVAILGAMGVATVVGFKTPSVRRRLRRGRAASSGRAPQLRSAQGWARAAWRRTEGSGRWGGAAGGGPGAGDPKATAVEGSGDRATAWQSGSAPTWSPRRMIWGSRTTIRTQNR